MGEALLYGVPAPLLSAVHEWDACSLARSIVGWLVTTERPSLSSRNLSPSPSPRAACFIKTASVGGLGLGGGLVPLSFVWLIWFC